MRREQGSSVTGGSAGREGEDGGPTTSAAFGTASQKTSIWEDSISTRTDGMDAAPAHFDLAVGGVEGYRLGEMCELADPAGEGVWTYHDPSSSSAMHVRQSRREKSLGW
jgi:hypothetical protein